MARIKVDMDEQESEAFDTWWKAMMTDDTTEGYKAIKKAGDDAVWWAVGSFCISYQDVVRSWVMTATALIEDGMDN